MAENIYADGNQYIDNVQSIQSNENRSLEHT